MILSDRDIRRALDSGRIRIDPLPDLESALGSISIDPRQPQSIGDAMRTIECEMDQPFIMQPGDFALASTIESLELPDDLLGRLEGRSSIRGWESRCTPLQRYSNRVGSEPRRWS
jgi:dCTP deaminase